MGKFDTIITESIQKFNRTDLVVGDVVKFNDKAFKGDWAKELSDGQKAVLTDLAKSGDILRIGSIISQGNLQAVKGMNPEHYHVWVVREIAPGLYTDKIMVPNCVLDLVQATGDQRSETPINSKIKREDKIEIKAHELKNTKYSLPEKDTKLPQTRGNAIKSNIASYMDGH